MLRLLVPLDAVATCQVVARSFCNNVASVHKSLVLAHDQLSHTRMDYGRPT